MAVLNLKADRSTNAVETRKQRVWSDVHRLQLTDNVAPPSSLEPNLPHDVSRG